MPESAMGIKNYNVDREANIFPGTFGSLTIITSTCNLVSNKKRKSAATNWNLYRTLCKNFAVS